MSAVNIAVLFALGPATARAVNRILVAGRDAAAGLASEPDLTGAAKAAHVVAVIRDVVDTHADDLGTMWPTLTEAQRDEVLDLVARGCYWTWMIGGLSEEHRRGLVARARELAAVTADLVAGRRKRRKTEEGAAG